ncbi:hypothetical protein TBLA_0A06910 [Henningerozyma blattae CBS 6284]|uniref:Large ribosomal subunit protein uL2m n=1 Tax=Henningerozyma blattae (strain ATCC 34711 / CBS 6284 / DSM 70876 / NBRC 10599 / NRRL Y-10934 / UCD 77-7) TaxID=1071380 RepID=I2GWI0_HENB6|nr:hypothetical protein TBLA_0A06910 [Tetrapisispora blattae CBS 6284]CCH58482.1 hypothetical protein TBLA_0A06910 [Tetrapisispora blattae CBS 6284]
MWLNRLYPPRIPLPLHYPVRFHRLATTESTPLQIIPHDTDLSLLEQQDALVKKRHLLSKNATPLRKHKPISPGLRWVRTPIHPHLFKGPPIRSLTIHKHKNGGRNNTGRITVRHQGGGHKRRLRLLDFHRNQDGPCTVLRIEYDPGRTSHIALLKHNTTGKLSYITACDGLRANDIVQSFRNSPPLDTAAIQRGNCLRLRDIPIGTILHNIALVPHGPGKLCRAAGTYGRLLDKLPEKRRAVVRLQSGEHRYVALDSIATIGIVSNVDHQNESWGKAGRARWRGIRPTVRGVAMNKCDHPHGGGRGKSKSNRLSVSPWGILAKGYKTRRGKNVNKMKIKDRPRGKRG